ncbi:MAG: DinB family protein [Ignavibacteria bacterium]|jgi:uncharacterized damage-inducible protein DinB
MKDVSYLGSLLKHMEWADAKVWQSILKLPAVNNDSVIKTFVYHIHAVQRAFFYVWTEQPLEFPDEKDFNQLIDIAKWGGDYYMEQDTYLKSINEEMLARELDIPWIKRLEEVIGKEPSKATLGESMLHVAMHTSYHRGQLNKRIRELGGEPQLIDLIVWIWKGKPKANWNG